MEPNDRLGDWGWDDGWAAAFGRVAGPASGGADAVAPARVVAQHRGLWTLVAGDGESLAEPTGRFRHEAGPEGLPAVGDWVGFSVAHHGRARIEALVTRRSAFRRRAAGSRAEAQIVAANVDTLFVATSLNLELKPRRLERYVAMAHESGAEPVVVLTKADLVDEAAAEAAAGRLEADLRVCVVPLSSRTGDGLGALPRWLAPGRTVALVGSSGVGKSTLLNRLAGEELQKTIQIREDDSRGRHATTHRELFRLPGGALLLDTPGMRELGLWDADEGLADTFAEIVEIASGCRFADCRHDREPGCAVREALETGRIDERRLRSYRRLERELADQPPPAVQRAEKRRFSKMVRDVSANTLDRKTYRER